MAGGRSIFMCGFHPRVVLAFWMLATCASFAAAETHALLVGVSGYPSLPPNMRLRGPANDVQLLQATFLKLGIAQRNIAILADGVPGGVLPTRGNILGGLELLRKNARAGDWAIVYFSGHGSQQPQQDARGWQEPDALDEIFLPYDIGSWDGRSGKVANAINDDEIGAALARFNRAGISVWAIFDTCHAGGMAKGMAGDAQDARDADTRWRRVAPQALGVPDIARTVAERGPRLGGRLTTPQPAGGVAPGQTVVFFAAQADEPTPEEAIPAARGRAVHGVFSWSLAMALEASRFASFAGVFGAVQGEYRSERRSFPTPKTEGRIELALPFAHAGMLKKAFEE